MFLIVLSFSWWLKNPGCFSGMVEINKREIPEFTNSFSLFADELQDTYGKCKDAQNELTKRNCQEESESKHDHENGKEQIT